MITEQRLEIIQSNLAQHDQQHLLTFWEQLSASQKDQLLEDIEQIDLEKIDVWVEKYVKNAPEDNIPTEFSAAPSYPACPETAEQQQKYEQAIKLGRELISAGKVAAFVVAGGQGTRLGFDGPKGDFPLAPLSGKTLFQIFAENIKAASQKYNVKLPWYVMTSPLNNESTRRIFKKNEYYGLNPEDVFIFQQGTLPNFGFDGKILLADKHLIARSPDGHGGSLKALYDSDAIADMRKRGIEYISYFQVDNALIKIFDPLFIGLHVLDNSQMSSKALIKAGPKEKVGNFCMANSKVQVIEYSDLPDEKAIMTNQDGKLVFRLGSIAIHMIDLAFVEKLNSKGFSLPLHRAIKKIPHIDLDGKYIDPEEPNGIKLESFVFDALPLAENSMILQVERAEEFAPTKNAAGTDSPESARQMIFERCAEWLEKAGIEVPRKTDGKPDAKIEIAPSFAIDHEDVKQKADLVPTIKPGDELYLE